MKSNVALSSASGTIDWGLWMQATKYVVWGVLAVALQEMCVVMHGICYLFSA